MVRKLIVLVIMSVINMAVFVMMLVSNDSLQLLLITHVVSLIVFYILNYFILRVDVKEYPVYLIVGFPGLGFTLFTIIYITTIAVPTRLKEIDHITIVDKEDDFVTFSFLDEEKVLTHLDSMAYLTQQEKLSFIFDVLDSDSINKARVLKESLMGENYDLRYYSSIYLSSMSNQLEAQVFKHKREFDHHQEFEALKKLLDVLHLYLDSKLLEDDMLHFYNNIYIDYLQKAIDMEVNIIEYTKELIKAYINEKVFDKARKLIELLDKSYELDMLLFELYYTKEDYIETRKIANSILKTYEDIPIKDQGILNYWR